MGLLRSILEADGSGGRGMRRGLLNDDVLAKEALRGWGRSQPTCKRASTKTELTHIVVWL